MAAQHLLPCPACNRSIIVEPAQAGRELTCECGSVSTAPTMRRIRELPLAPVSEEKKAADTWQGPKRTVFSLGLAALLVGLVLVIAFQTARRGLNTELPPLADVEGVNEQLDALPVDELFVGWKSTIRTSELVEPETPNQIVLDRRKDRRYFSLVVTGAVLIVGGIAGMGWASLRKNSNPNT